MKSLFTLILLGALAYGAYWFYTKGQDNPKVVDAEKKVEEGAQRAKDKIKDKLDNTPFNADNVREELAKSGRVVRQKARQLKDKVADATVDARTTATIKAKLFAESELASLGISVDTTDGVVTLAGSAKSAEQISQAMKIALDQDGVREVVSTVQIKQSKP